MSGICSRGLVDQGGEMYTFEWLRLPRHERAGRCLADLFVPMVRGVPIMQAQEVDAVVVAVRRAHDGVHMEFCRLGIRQKHAGVVVELDEDHRALDAIVKRAFFFESADPTEMRVGEMPLDKANVMLRCGSCHTRKTNAERARRMGA